MFSIFAILSAFFLTDISELVIKSSLEKTSLAIYSSASFVLTNNLLIDTVGAYTKIKLPKIISNSILNASSFTPKSINPTAFIAIKKKAIVNFPNSEKNPVTSPDAPNNTDVAPKSFEYIITPVEVNIPQIEPPICLYLLVAVSITKVPKILPILIIDKDNEDIVIIVNMYNTANAQPLVPFNKNILFFL